MSYAQRPMGDYKTYGYAGDPGWLSSIWKGVKRIAPTILGGMIGGPAGAHPRNGRRRTHVPRWNRNQHGLAARTGYSRRQRWRDRRRTPGPLSGLPRSAGAVSDRLPSRQRRFWPHGSQSAHEHRQPSGAAPRNAPRTGLRENGQAHDSIHAPRQDEEAQLMTKHGCGQCGKKKELCGNCHNCSTHCACAANDFDSDELGLDPETDNTPKTGSRHA